MEYIYELVVKNTIQDFVDAINTQDTEKVINLLDIDEIKT